MHPCILCQCDASILLLRCHCLLEFLHHPAGHCCAARSWICSWWHRSMPFADLGGRTKVVPANVHYLSERARKRPGVSSCLLLRCQCARGVDKASNLVRVFGAPLKLCPSELQAILNPCATSTGFLHTANAQSSNHRGDCHAMQPLCSPNFTVCGTCGCVLYIY